MEFSTETVTLINKVSAGTNSIGEETWTETETEVSGVLIGQPDTQEIADEMSLSGKRIAYVLAVPKGDANDWEDAFVEFWGGRYRTIGTPTQGIEDNIPLSWNKKVKVERYVRSED